MTSDFLADPYPFYTGLRQAAPVNRITLPDGSEVWLVTRYADVRAALADPRLSLSKANATGGWRGFSLPPALDANLLNMDPPDHTRIRRLVSQAFTARRIDRLRPWVQQVADDLLDTVAPTGRADLIADLAGPLPVAVICELLGVPEANRPDVRSWTDVMIAPPPDDPRAAARAVGAIHAFLANLVAAKRAEPGDDLLSAMIAARDADDRLSENELTSLAFLILFAGYENSVHAIGNGLLTLLRHPAALADLSAEPQHVTSAVEEILRFEPPSPLAIRRFPTEDVAIGGVTVPKGATVLLAVAAANRDPDRFIEPEEFDLQRADNLHLTLGHGIHYCLGAPLARMEIEIVIDAVVRRFPAIELAVPADELRWRPSFRSRALQALPVLLDSRS